VLLFKPNILKISDYKEAKEDMHRKHGFIVLLTIVCFTLITMPTLYAQDNGNVPPDGGIQDRPDEQEPPAGGYPENEDFIEPYGLGSQVFSINAGLFFPLFFHFPGADERPELNTFEPAWGQLSLGGTGSLSWGGYLTPRFALGGKLAGSFAFTPRGYIHSMIPITMWAEYLFRYGSFEFPLSLEGGIVINRVQDQAYFGPIAIPGISGYYNLNAEWGLGLSLKYWWVPEIYFGDKADVSSFGNFLELSFSARYHFS